MLVSLQHMRWPPSTKNDPIQNANKADIENSCYYHGVIHRAVICIISGSKQKKCLASSRPSHGQCGYHDCSRKGHLVPVGPQTGLLSFL